MPPDTKTAKQRIISNFLVMGTGQIGTMAISAVLLIFVSRYLGPDRYGELTLAVSISSILNVVVGLGTHTMIVRSVAQTPERAGVIASTALMIRGALSLTVPVALTVYVYFAHFSWETSTVVCILSASMVIYSLGDALQAVLQGREQMSRVVLNNLVSGVLEVVFVLVVIGLHGGVVAAAIAIALCSPVWLAMNLFWTRHIAPLTWRVPREDFRGVLTGSLAFLSQTISLSIYTNIDAVLLGMMAGSGAVGLYSPATRVFSAALFLPTIIFQVTFPLLARLGIEAGDDFRRAGKKMISLLVACSVPIAVGLVIGAGPIVLTLFGSSYRPSIPVLMVVSLCFLPMVINMQFAEILSARSQQWRWTRIMVVSAVVNPALNLALIPFAIHRWHNGALGAAWALLGTELFMLVYGLCILRTIVLDVRLARSVGGALIAGVGQAGVLLLVSAQGIIPAEILGGAAYGLLALALGVLPRHDTLLILETAIRRPLRRAA